MYTLAVVCLCAITLGNALPSPLLSKLGSDLRYQYAEDSAGKPHLVDFWLTAESAREAARYDPVRNNGYHLFTRENPTVSQPLVLNNANILYQSNFRSSRRTIVLIHSWLEGSSADFNTVLVPAFLGVEDVNVIVVDWSAGAMSINHRIVIANTVTSGRAVADFINWLNRESGCTAQQYHIVGFGFGGHQAGVVGRNVVGDVAYITALDAALLGWSAHPDRFKPNDGQYTEVIHTNVGFNGFVGALGLVDFYPNGGISMPGCDSNACDHARSFHFFAESLSTGGFTGRQCINYFAAITGTCTILPGTLQMGGLRPKTGSLGVFWMETNGAPPFSRG